MEAVFPCFALDVVQGTIDILESKEDFGHEYYDIVDDNFEFWDSDGRRVSFRDTSSAAGLSFSFDFEVSTSDLIGIERMHRWAATFGVDASALVDVSLSQLFQIVSLAAPLSVT